ncbi:embryo-specific protein ATS3A-like [Mercurialis annua]|uniref:embryo-specific protein ATS3A-like n=1 Tax=Mercurialis annua TaxID=3986 RepID=UPI00215ECA04|nr:embryo-specific protein ATS3A-like [Mercurialis annua]
MVKLISVLIIFVFFSIICTSLPNPQPHDTFRPKSIQAVTANARSCSYTIVIRTSCSSSSYTRDHISLAFGDSYGHEVYLKRLDDPSSGTFERCSTDTFKINGACIYDICYLYLLRTGSDGWKPETVNIYGPNTKTATFKFNTFLPNGVWFGFKTCSHMSLSTTM